MMDKKKSLEDFASEAEQAQYAENQKLARKLRAVTAELGTQRAARVQAEKDLAVLEHIYEEGAVLTPQPDWLRPDEMKSAKAERGVTLCAFLSDTHIGEVVRPEEMRGYNAFNLEIADLRLRRFFEKTIMLSREFMGAMRYDGIVLPFGGDGVSGAIHDELRETDELSVLESVIWLAPRLVAGIERFAEEFGNVHVVKADGNHGRDSHKPRYKKRSAHNADTALMKMVAMFFAQSNPSAEVTFDIPESWDAAFSIYEWRFALEHGEELQKNNPGTSEIGALGPVKRGTLRKARQHEQEGHPFDYNLVGHYHQYVPAYSQGFVMNGSLIGFNEYARGLHLKPEPPQQALMVVTPENGITGNYPILVGKRDAEGW